MSILLKFRPLSILILKNSHIFCKGIHRPNPKFHLPPFTWNLGKTLVTSNSSFKSNDHKSNTLVNQNENKITEKKENEEEDNSFIVGIPKKNRHQCPHCPKSYTRAGNLTRHINDKHSNLKPLAHQASLDKNKTSKHSENENKITEKIENEEKDESLILAITEKKRHQCPHCPKSLSTAGNLKTHIKTVHLGLKPYKCDYCDKSFSQKGNLDQHISDVHLKLKPFKCDFCGESFAQKATLDNHIASMHTEDLKQVKCPEPDCGKTFKNSKQLGTHIRKFHTVTDHQCPHCKMYCTTKSGLNTHIDKCLNNRKFKCEECGAAFVQKGHLDDHMKHKHSDERNYVCDFEGCGEAFKSEPALYIHKKSHSDEKLHQCRYCPKAYKTNQNLQTHVYKEHPEEYKQENDQKVEE